ncbi:unnamed protein product [Moneuplotes crassus]|uniref:Cyclin-like domain-containing protein n=1 Tax=Euplotes crassus TaxID=5936 RepID=A0AAD1URN6_EUPCR|nr:unnamed protein product [Moneuplotes crassus]
MAHFLQRGDIQVEVCLESFDCTDSEGQDSPVLLDTSSGEICAEDMTVSNEISVNMNQLSVISIDSQLNLCTQRENGQLKKLLGRLDLSDHFTIKKLTLKDVEIFDFMNKELREHFSLSLCTIHLAFTVYLQFLEKVRCSPIPTAISCLLCAAKFNESQYNVPYIEEIIKFVPREDKVSQNIIERQEIMVLIENDWNLLQTTLWKSLQYLIASKKELEKCQHLLESEVHKGKVFAVPKRFGSLEEIYKRENSVADIGLLGAKSEIEIVRKKYHKKQSKSFYNIDENFKCSNEGTKKSSNFLEVPKKSKKKRRKGNKCKKLKMSRIRKISEGLSDILRIYESTDSENTKSNISNTEGSTFNDSISTISDNCRSVSQTGHLMQSERDLTDGLPNESSEEVIEIIQLPRS